MDNYAGTIFTLWERSRRRAGEIKTKTNNNKNKDESKETSGILEVTYW